MSELTPIRLPSMGEGVHEATVVKWLKTLGQKVEKGEPLLEVSTDKVDTEIASPAAGYLCAIVSKDGATVGVNTALGFLADSPNAEVPTELLAASAPTPARSAASAASSTPAHAPAHTGRSAEGFAPAQPQFRGEPVGSVRSSPLARKLARERGVNLADVQGSGLYGRITKDDLFAHLEHGGSRVRQYAAMEEPQALNLTRKGEQELLEGVPVRREAMSKMRRLTAEHMLRSVRTSPHVTTTFEIDLAQVEKFKKETEERFVKEHGFKLTYTSFFIHAAIQAIKEFPETNAAIDGHEILYRDEINMGCAVAIESGLIVPVIRDAGDLSLTEVAVRLNDIVTRAREKKLTPQDVQGGTFSVTNPGMFGSLHSQPIINQPQVAIMSIGAIVKRPVAVKNDIVVHPLCQVGLTFDHRLIDGEGGAKFLAHVKQNLERGR